MFNQNWLQDNTKQSRRKPTFLPKDRESTELTWRLFSISCLCIPGFCVSVESEILFVSVLLCPELYHSAPRCLFSKVRPPLKAVWMNCACKSRQWQKTKTILWAFLVPSFLESFPIMNSGLWDLCQERLPFFSDFSRSLFRFFNFLTFLDQ